MTRKQPLLERLRRRKLVQWAVAYLAGAWVLLQILDLLAQPFAWPDLVLRVATAVLGVGLLAVLVLAWYHGERGAQKVNGIELLMLGGILVIAGSAVAFVSEDGLRNGHGAPDSGRTDASITSITGTVERNSIAVLPFSDMSPEGDQEYFTDGITEEILNVLAQLQELRVAARTSSFAFKGSAVPMDSIARALRVAHVLEGSVRKAGDRVRITAQLIDARTGYHLWSETYDRRLQDIFAVQDEIARAIVNALQLELGGSRAGMPLAKEETRDPEAHAAVLRGMHLLGVREREALDRATSFFRQAIARDPDYARAYAGLARVYSYQAYRRWGPRHTRVEEARAAVRRALTLDPELAEAHHVLGDIAYVHDWDPRAAESHYRRAIALNPGVARPYGDLAEALSARGQVEEAIAAGRRAAELDPVSGAVFHALGNVYLNGDSLDRAVETYRTSLSLRPENPSTLTAISQAHSLADRHEAAVDAVRRARTRAASDQWALAASCFVHARAGETTQAHHDLALLEAQPDASPYLLAIAHAGLGNADRMFALLERAVAEKDPDAVAVAVDPVFNAYRADPRMRVLLDRAGFEPAGKAPS